MRYFLAVLGVLATISQVSASEKKQDIYTVPEGHKIYILNELPTRNHMKEFRHGEACITSRGTFILEKVSRHSATGSYQGTGYGKELSCPPDILVGMEISVYHEIQAARAEQTVMPLPKR